MESEFEELKLIDAARTVLHHSYSPYSHFAVGAALQTRSGKIFTGTNVENVSYALTLCAERAAVAAAVAAGDCDLHTLALISDSREPIVPCGACRQVLAEFNVQLRIVSVTLAGERRLDFLYDLLPCPRRGIVDNATR